MAKAEKKEGSRDPKGRNSKEMAVGEQFLSCCLSKLTEDSL